MILVLMGPTGSGKTTVGRALATRIGATFYDADDFHSPSNIEKMRHGQPLSDADREGWLVAMRSRIGDQLARGERAVWACSALKGRYRELLRAGSSEVRFVYLRVPEAVLRDRLRQRVGHFADERLLESQLASLESPAHALIVDASADVDAVAAAIAHRLEEHSSTR